MTLSKYRPVVFPPQDIEFSVYDQQPAADISKAGTAATTATATARPLHDESWRSNASEDSYDQFRSGTGTSGAAGNVARQTSAKSSDLQRYFENHWNFEILCAVFSIGCLVGVIVVLALYSGRPLAEWHMPININTLISVFVTLAKSSMLCAIAACVSQLKWNHFATGPQPLVQIQTFDDASRGPYGALKLILALRKSSLMATVAAAITVLALAIDPFAQQILSFPAHLAPSELAFVGFTQLFDTRLGSHPYSSKSNVSAELQFAVYTGLFSLNQGSVFQCPTSYCSFDFIASLGICNSCQEVTSQAQKECMEFSQSSEGCSGSSCSSRGCRYTLPSGVELWALEGDDGVTTVNSTSNNNSGLPYLANTSTLVTLIGDSYENDGHFPTARIWECSFELCLNFYNNTMVVNSSNVHSEVSGYYRLKNTLSAADLVHEDGDNNSKYYVTFGIGDAVTDQYQSSDNNSLENSLTQDLTWPPYLKQSQGTTFTSEEGDSAFLTYENATEVVTTTQNTLWNFPDSTVIANLPDLTSFSSFLTNVFSATQKVKSYVPESASASQSNAFNIADVIYDGYNLVDIMDSIADSITHYIRTGGNSASRSQIGTAFEPQSHIMIRWEWSILPFGLILAGCTLLAVLSRKSGIVLWKASSLPLLYHGLAYDREASPDRGKLRDVWSMKLEANETIAQLRDHEGDAGLNLMIQDLSKTRVQEDDETSEGKASFDNGVRTTGSTTSVQSDQYQHRVSSSYY